MKSEFRKGKRQNSKKGEYIIQVIKLGTQKIAIKTSIFGKDLSYENLKRNNGPNSRN